MAGAAGRAIGDLWEGKLSSFEDYAKSTAEGALVGAAVGSGGAALGAAVGGAIAVGGALVEGRVPTPGEVIAGAAGGALAGIGLPIGGKAVAAGAKGAVAGAALKGEVAQVANGATSAKQAADLSKHLRYSEKYGKAGIKELEDGRVRYSGDVKPPNTPGEMAGRRYVHEYDPATGRSRGWHETVDQYGNVRQVRPELNNGNKTHYMFDQNGNYIGSW